MWSLEEAIAVAGGAVTAESCPEVVSPETLREVLTTVYQTNAHFEALGRRMGAEVDWAITLTQSPAFACTVREVQDRYAILVPLGMVARARVAARLLLRHWRTEKFPRFIRSPIDKIDDDPDSVPPLLKPLFLESLAPAEFWDGLLELDRSLDLDAAFEPDVLELMHLALVYFLSHEFTHVAHGHFGLMAKARAGAVQMDTTRLMRGLELDADDGAAAITMQILNDDVISAQNAGQESSMELAWLRLAYAVTMLLAITDTIRKHYPAYEHGAYNHPMVRCEFFFEAVERALDEPEDVKAIWRKCSGKGWERCVCALEMLNLEAFSGKFGAVPSGKEFAPLHAMLYGTPRGATSRSLLRQLQQTIELLREVRKLIPTFQQA